MPQLDIGQADSDLRGLFEPAQLVTRPGEPIPAVGAQTIMSVPGFDT